MNVSIRPHLLMTALTCGLLASVPAATVSGQEPTAPKVAHQGAPAESDTVPTGARLPRLHRRLVTSRDIVVGVAFATAAMTLIPADARIAREFQRPAVQSSAALRGTADGAEMIASPGALIFGGSLYALGHMTRSRTPADLGWHTLEAMAVSGQVTSLLKGLFGRSRPYAAAGDARDFELGGGFGSATRRSLPSGHTSMAFTFASVVDEETSHRWPRAHRIVAPLAYAAATSVGLARMYNDKHWASDIALGAAIGTLSGKLVVRYAHARRGNLIDRFALRGLAGR